MPGYDGSHGARARSARIRAAHDYEATELDAMQRRSVDRDQERTSRGALATHLVTALGRLRGRARGGGTDGLRAESEPELLGRVNLGN